jgi:altronate dehydratase large subunit
LGAILKGGTARIQGILEYGERPTRKGLYIMDSPGRKMEMLTGLAAAGVQMIVFSTGRGALQGFPIVPVLKVTGNSRTFSLLKEEMDVDVSSIIMVGESIEDAGRRIFDEMLSVANGKQTKSEAL